MIWRLFREIENEDVDEDTNNDEISPSMEEGAPLPHVTYLERGLFIRWTRWTRRDGV